MSTKNTTVTTQKISQSAMMPPAIGFSFISEADKKSRENKIAKLKKSLEPRRFTVYSQATKSMKP